MKAVIDTNVLVSGIFWRGRPFRILEHWTEGKFELVVSAAILEEYAEVLRRIGGQHGRGALAESWCRLISRSSVLVEAPGIYKKCRDPHDNMFVDCALASESHIIISGDDDLLSIKRVGKILILNCEEAAGYLAANRSFD